MRSAAEFSIGYFQISTKRVLREQSKRGPGWRSRASGIEKEME
jgi:hypothetical protein